MLIDLYLGVENLGLTNAQRNTLVAAVAALGQNYLYPFPVRLDAQAGIYEAQLRTGDLLHYGWRARLGSLFSVDPLSIDVYESADSYSGGTSTVFVLSRLGTDYLRIILFGGITASKDQSRRECLGYLFTNAATWYA